MRPWGRTEAGPGALLERHARLLEEVEFLGGYSYHSRMREVLAGLGIGEERLEQDLGTFSGGQRTRVALARLLLSERELLLLDEPTNHLDLEATEWLEEYLAQASPAVIVVSHDRYFLDRVAAAPGSWRTAGWRPTPATTPASPSRRWSAWPASRRSTRPSRSTSSAPRPSCALQGRPALPPGPQAAEAPRPPGADLPPQRAGQRAPADPVHPALRGHRAGDGGAGRRRRAPGASPCSDVTPGQPVVWAAPAGGWCHLRPSSSGPRTWRCSGASGSPSSAPTGQEDDLPARHHRGDGAGAGRLYVGYGVQLAYYAQAHEQLTPGRTVLQEIQAAAPGGRGGSDVPGRFLFSNDDAFKTVRSLSGERSRPWPMALGNANLLVLDEPTNHLDIYSRAALEDVLTGFAGTVIFVSHDRYLIDALATRLGDRQQDVTTHRGGWTEYLADRGRRPLPPPSWPDGNGRSGRAPDGRDSAGPGPAPGADGRARSRDRRAQAQLQELDEALSARATPETAS